VLSDTNLRIDNLEKLIMMQEALPRDLAKEFRPRANIDSTVFYNEIKGHSYLLQLQVEKRQSIRPKINRLLTKSRSTQWTTLIISMIIKRSFVLFAI